MLITNFENDAEPQEASRPRLPWSNEVLARSKQFARQEQPSPLLIEFLDNHPEKDYRKK